MKIKKYGSWCCAVSAVIAGVADEWGRMSVTFASAAADCEARFSGLQIRGTDFPDYIPNGTLVIVR